MKRALLVLSFVLATTSSSIVSSSIASADIPPPDQTYEPAAPPMSDFERGRMVGRAIAPLCGLACCFGVPAVGVLAALVVAQRKKKR
ncbi:hypothetical protein [Sandaracinus amylolyticus]|uniref:Uncharacterized protein n=1 Tax=Sandaracinus amylolyticus TaxID=927083 RepID=A0A0F6SGQ8_9BACT|nr:hypothetical protein [Sandaracinus amylolyticus]AKF09119.1 hypothetical protein DB32_006268 [Sandaracinus amylolyticus]